MAIDASIYNLVDRPDWGANAGRGLLTGLQARSIYDRQSEDRENRPLRNKLLDAQVSDAETTASANEMDFQLADMAQDAMLILPQLSSDPQRAVASLQQRAEKILARGGDPSDTIGVLQRVQSGDMQGAAEEMQTVIDAANQRGVFGGGNADIEAFRNMTQGMTPEQVAQARLYKAGLTSRPTEAITLAGDKGLSGAVGDSQSDIEGRVSGARERGKINAQLDASEQTTKAAAGEAAATAGAKEVGQSKEERRTARIEIGGDSAKAIPMLKRSIALLERIDTGGAAQVSLGVKQALGVESADEGELSNKLGKAVLVQLKSTFGAAFSEKEGGRLERIEAGFGKSAATNKRLLNELLQVSTGYAEQAVKDAVSIEDYETAAAIKKSMSFEYAEDADLFPAAQKTKTINGVEYVKQGDKWFIKGDN